MFSSFATTLLLVSVVGVCNAAQVALTNARRNRLEAELSKRSAGAEAALGLMGRIDDVVAGARVAVALCVVAAVLLPGEVLVSQVASLVGGSALVAEVVVVSVLSFIVVVCGDLLPSRLAERYPETVARFLAPLVSGVVSLVRPLSMIANAIVSRVLGPLSPEQVSDEDVEEDIRDLVDEGQRAGVIEPGEREIINRVFKLDDKPLATLMTPRADVVFLNREDPLDSTLFTAASSKHTWFPVRASHEDDVLGIVCLSDLVELKACPDRFPGGLSEVLVQPIEVPISMSALKLLELFREDGGRFAIVRDEYGTLSGIVTVYDVLQVIVGEIGESGSPEERWFVRREDGSYLVDASSDIREVFETLRIADESPFNGAEFHSLGGFVMTTLGYVPKEGERFEAFGYLFEVIDMDNNRIDKVLVTQVAEQKAVGE
jgi:putative hemolysin